MCNFFLCLLLLIICIILSLSQAFFFFNNTEFKKFGATGRTGCQLVVVVQLESACG